MGRTGTLFACEQEHVTPDLIAIGKGLAGGYQPIGAVLAAAKITRAIESGSGALAQGHTYMGHPIACAAAVAVQEVIEDEQLLQNAQRMGNVLEQSLRDRFASRRYVGDIRGRGLFWALELVEDKNEKRPFAPSLKLAARIKREALERGLICYPSPGAADGSCGDNILLAPPYIINDTQIGEMVDILARTLETVLR
jgi:adenosylmethionine-8-amino-7-oxononanoate aminotransferase